MKVLALPTGAGAKRSYDCSDSELPGCSEIISGSSFLLCPSAPAPDRLRSGIRIRPDLLSTLIPYCRCRQMRTRPCPFSCHLETSEYGSLALRLLRRVSFCVLLHAILPCRSSAARQVAISVSHMTSGRFELDVCCS